MVRWMRAALAAMIAAVAACVALTGCGGLSTGGTAASSTMNRGVYPATAKPFGKTYGEWSVEWWKWVAAAPEATHPVLDETGTHAAVGQSGPVWFLAGTFMAPTVERTCTVPADKALLFPLVNWIYWLSIDTDTEKGARDWCKQATDRVTELRATVDGVALEGLHSFHFPSPDFFYTAFNADDPLFDQAGTFEAFAEGYWVMLEPLTRGQHTISFGGKSVFPATFPDVQVFNTNVTYHLTVE